MKKLRIAFLAGSKIFLLLLFLVACSSSIVIAEKLIIGKNGKIIDENFKKAKKGPAILPAQEAAPQEEQGMYLKKGWEFTTNKYGSSVIKGTVKNNSSKNIGYAQITFGIYDKGGAKIGASIANISNLDPNGLWKFSALVLQDDAYTAKFEGISGF